MLTRFSVVAFYFLFTNFAYSSPDANFLGLKAGLVLSGDGQPTLKKNYSYPISAFQTYFCRALDGLKSSCSWKKLDGNNRFSLIRSTEDEVTGRKAEHNLTIQQEGTVANVTRWVVGTQDMKRFGLVELAKMMAKLEEETKASAKRK